MKLLNKVFDILFNWYRRHQGYGVGYYNTPQLLDQKVSDAKLIF